MTTRQLGAPIRRREDPRLLTGNGRYLDDLGAGALHAAFVRSTSAHARIVDIDITDAWEVEGVEAIYTYEDLEGPMAQPLPVLTEGLVFLTVVDRDGDHHRAGEGHDVDPPRAAVPEFGDLQCGEGEDCGIGAPRGPPHR